MTCLVVGNHTQGLGILRSLGTLGIKPHVLYDKHVSMARFSKYCATFNRVKSGALKKIYYEEMRDEVEKAMLSLVPRGEKWVLFGVDEDIINFFYDRQEKLREKFLFPVNDIRSITDKYEFARVTTEAGVQSPDTFLLSEFNNSMLTGEYFVAKGRTGNKFRNISNIKGFRVHTHKDLSTIRQYVKDKVKEDEVILQKMIESDSNVHSCCGFSVNGEIFVVLIYEKVRQVPDEYGTGVFAISRDVSEIRDRSKIIIGALKYTGIFEIEFLKDNSTDQFMVIEMNPRTWKSISLATACNKNLCANYYNYMREDLIPELSLIVPEGKRWAHFAADLVYMLKKGSFKFDYSKDITFCDLSWDDPMPFLAQALLLPLVKLGI